MSKKLTANQLREKGELFGYYDGNDVYRLGRYYFVVEDEVVNKVRRDDVETDAYAHDVLPASGEDNLPGYIEYLMGHGE